MTVSKQIKEDGLLKRSTAFYVLLLSGLTLALAGTVAGIILLGDNWLQLLMAGALGLIFTQFAFIAHEASHRQVLTSGPANDRLGRILITLVAGMSYQWWMTKHTRHHANPNRIGKDPDIEVDTIAFYPESAAEQRGVFAWITRRQGWLFYPLMMLEGLNLHYHSIRSLVRPGKVEGRWFELSMIALRFAVYFGAIFTFLPLGMAFAFVGVQLAVFGFYLGTAFAVNHIGLPIIAADMKLDFFSKQVHTSRNISGGWVASSIFGGLNYQIEHHLFPNMARPQLAQARLIVREYCRANNIRYTEMNMFRANAHVVKYMHKVGLAARDPFVCHLLAQYRRA